MKATVLALFASLAFAACGGSATPCTATTCPDMSGLYHFTAAPAAAAQSSCQQLYFSGIDSDIQINQSGASVTLVSLLEQPGTLLADLSVTFPQKKTSLTNGDPATLDMSGHFSGDAGSHKLVVTMRYSATLRSTNTPCSLTVSGVMTQKAK